jgi:hypothetical protein
MNFDDQLTAVMRSTADAVTPPVTDLVARGTRRGRQLRRRQTVRRSALSGVGVIAAGAIAVTLATSGGHGATTTGPGVVHPVTPTATAFHFPSGTAALPGETSALAIDGEVPVGAALDRHDPTATAGPWTVVVRRTGGSLGSDGAVITFPVSAATTAHPVQVGGVTGFAGTNEITWPMAGAAARIRGDLPPSELAAIAALTSVSSGRPTVRPPAGFAVDSSGSYQPSDIHETRYGTAALLAGSSGDAGLTYAGVTSGGGFEDQLYIDGVIGRTTVNGQPAVLSSVLGGNATLAWEPAPGIIAYVGYSGGVGPDVIKALLSLAERAVALTEAQWQSTDPLVGVQSHAFG